jgi:dCMP deaminase
MLIGIVGQAFAGKSTIAQYLLGLSFTELTIIHTEPQSRHEFNSATQVLDYVMHQWRNNYVLTGIENAQDWKVLLKRPFFLMIAVECPVAVRFERHSRSMSLQDFVRLDNEMYLGLRKDHSDAVGGMVGLSLAKNVSLFSIMNHAHLKILNISESVQKLYEYLDQLDLLNHERLRPSWDTYFMKLCDLAASRSNCKWRSSFNLRYEKTCRMYSCKGEANHSYRI